eukprot:7383300-Prymnesium_polylepis.1
MNTAQSAGSLLVPSPTPMRSDADGNIDVGMRERHAYDACPLVHTDEPVLAELAVGPADVTSSSIVTGVGRSRTALSPPTSNTNVDADTVSYAARLPLPDATVPPAANQPEKVFAYAAAEGVLDVKRSVLAEASGASGVDGTAGGDAETPCPMPVTTLMIRVGNSA